MPGASRPLQTRNDHPAPLDLSFGGGEERARNFHFAVTWATLFAHLDPIQADGPRRRSETPPRLALVPAAPAAVAPRRTTTREAWEMVVPRMIRTGAGTFEPAESEPGA